MKGHVYIEYTSYVWNAKTYVDFDEDSQFRVVHVFLFMLIPLESFVVTYITKYELYSIQLIYTIFIAFIQRIPSTTVSLGISSRKHRFSPESR